MRRLEYHFSCLDGTYFLTCELNDNVTYEIETDIEGFSSRSGELSQTDSARFAILLKEAQIEKWDRSYKGEAIEDGISWKLVYICDEKEYVSEGEETYEPYHYGSLIEAFKMIEDKADYFRAQVNE